VLRLPRELAYARVAPCMDTGSGGIAAPVAPMQERGGSRSRADGRLVFVRLDTLQRIPSDARIPDETAALAACGVVVSPGSARGAAERASERVDACGRRGQLGYCRRVANDAVVAAPERARTAEVVAALCLATDLALGFPASAVPRAR
jgi:hypothetical protein